jgi:hypothetical protein
MPATPCTDDTEIDMLGPELTPDEERALIEREVRRNFSISLDEFRRRWAAGEYRESDDPRVTSAAILLH